MLKHTISRTGLGGLKNPRAGGEAGSGGPSTEGETQSPTGGCAHFAEGEADSPSAKWRVVVDGVPVFTGSEVGAREAYESALRLEDAFVVELIEPEGQ